MTDTFAHRLIAYMQEERRRLGVEDLTFTQKVKAINAYHSADQATTRMLKTKVKPLRTALFMALCKFEGIDVKHMPKMQVKNINDCVTQLRDVSPELVAEEIEKRGALFVKQRPSWTKEKFTARALVKNWGTLFNGTTLPSKVDEPAGWRDRINEIFTPEEREASPAMIDGLRKIPWQHIHRERQASIIRRMQKLTQAQPTRDATAEAYF